MCPPVCWPSVPVRARSPLSLSLTEDIKKAAYTIRNFMYSSGIIQDGQVPIELLRMARGLAVSRRQAAVAACCQSTNRILHHPRCCAYL
jgi:hypothetical protein